MVRTVTRIPRRAPVLPAWPVVALFVGFPLWWVIGLADAMWFIGALPMAGYLVRERGRVVLPKGFGLWALFVVWMLASVIEIDTGGRILGFIFRASLYVGIGIIFVYIYNARDALSLRKVSGILSLYWIIVVAGGLLAVLKPHGELHTLMSHVIPYSLQKNDLVSQMVVPHFSQGNPTGYFKTPPRPAAPFDFTNTWGNSFSLLIPFVFIYLSKLQRNSIRFWGLLGMLPVSLIPAFETQNRGMFLGLGFGMTYIAVRYAVRGHAKGLLALFGFIAMVFLFTRVIPVQSQIEARVSTGASNGTRLAVYEETYRRTLESPIFGYGAPRPSEVLVIAAPAVGTQGQFWLVMFSSGFVGLALFEGWLIFLCLRTARAPTTDELWLSAVILMGTLEGIYYGLVGSGLTLIMVSGALALSGRARTAIPPMTALRVNRRPLPARTGTLVGATRATSAGAGR